MKRSYFAKICLRIVGQEYLESFEISVVGGWTDHCTDRGRKEVLQRVKEGRNILHTVQRRKGKWTGHILRWKCLLKHFIEGTMEGMGKRGRRRKQLLDDLKETRRYWKLRESTRSPSAENVLWKWVWTSRKTDCVIMMISRKTP